MKDQVPDELLVLIATMKNSIKGSIRWSEWSGVPDIVLWLVLETREESWEKDEEGIKKSCKMMGYEAEIHGEPEKREGRLRKPVFHLGHVFLTTRSSMLVKAEFHVKKIEMAGELLEYRPATLYPEDREAM
jgi:hypothetical protein